MKAISCVFVYFFLSLTVSSLGAGLSTKRQQGIGKVRVKPAVQDGAQGVQNLGLGQRLLQFFIPPPTSGLPPIQVPSGPSGGDGGSSGGGDDTSNGGGSCTGGEAEGLDASVCASADACRVAAESLGLQIGGSTFSFEGAWADKGCYYYPSDHPLYPNEAYFGIGGTCTEVETETITGGGLRLSCDGVVPGDEDQVSPTVEETTIGSCQGPGTTTSCSSLFSSRSCSACNNGPCYGILDSCDAACGSLPGCSCDLDIGVCIIASGTNTIRCTGTTGVICSDFSTPESCASESSCTWVEATEPPEIIETGANSTLAPTSSPSEAPTSDPSGAPTETPVSAPTAIPTAAPSDGLIATPSQIPSTSPTESPTSEPTATPSQAPSPSPSDSPSESPNAVPASEITETTSLNDGSSTSASITIRLRANTFAVVLGAALFFAVV